MRLFKLYSCLLAVLFLFAIRAKAQDAMDESIKKVVKTETESYFKGDADTWQSSWVQSPKTSRVYVGAMLSRKTGWENFGPRVISQLKADTVPVAVEVSTDSFNISYEGKVAVADYKQTLTFPSNASPFNKSETLEHRVLVKKDNKWKILSSVTSDINLYGNNSTELIVNAAGYKLMQDQKMDEAIKILELNTKLFPESFNVFDSLGEAYALAGNKEMAIQNYEKSLQLYPNESGKKALAKLKE